MNIIWLGLGALLIGSEKAGIKGLSMVAVSIFAVILGGKASSGLLLILFMLADLFAVRYYFKASQFPIVFRLLSPAVVGIFLGAWLGIYIDDDLFKDIIAIIILSCLGLVVFQHYITRSNLDLQHPVVWISIGFITGFSTMIANVSSPILAIYLLALRLPKNQFIGTIIWFFFIVNFIKLPFHIWSWQTIQYSTLGLALTAIPVIGLGFLLGIRIVGRIPELGFRYLIIGVTVIASLKLLFS